jgi:hypothetical protein
MTNLFPGHGPDGPVDLETKYVFHQSIAPKVISWLKGRVAADRDHPAGIISSIYYDSKGWDFLGEKINSDYLKSKARLRWYLEFDSGKPLADSFFEIKYKTGLRRKKIRLPAGLSGEFLETVSLDDPRLHELPARLDCRGRMTFREHVFPVFLLRYRRLRFFEPASGTRISVDYDIHVPKVRPGLPFCPNPVTLAHAVLEIKGPICHLPDLLLFLNHMGCLKQSFSKYLAGYRHLTRVCND